MKIRLICMGKTDDPPVRKLLDDYTQRIGRYCPFSVREIPNLKKRSPVREEEVRSAEADLILKLAGPDDFVVLLDERGREMGSQEFSVFLNQRFLSGNKALLFIVGGAYGVDDRVKNRAAAILSLSRMTFPHQLVRVLFAEQLYRALTLLRNEPYHHG